MVGQGDDVGTCVGVSKRQGRTARPCENILSPNVPFARFDPFRTYVLCC